MSISAAVVQPARCWLANVHTGEAMVGNFGSAERLTYTCMGDAVNLAARLESAAKMYGIYTMTWRMLQQIIMTEPPQAQPILQVILLMDKASTDREITYKPPVTS